jgi:hypothetical protein
LDETRGARPTLQGRKFLDAADQCPDTPKPFAFQRLEVGVRSEEAEPVRAADRHSHNGLVGFDYETI